MGVSKRTLRAGHKQPGLRGLLKTGSALAVILMLGACSSVPDAINPVEWGKSIGDAFSGQEGPEKSEQPIPGQEKDYPRLADTPSRPVVTGDAERETLLAGLAADRANARYTTTTGHVEHVAVNPLAAPAGAPAPANATPAEAMEPAKTASAASTATTTATAAAAPKAPEKLPEPAAAMPEPKPADLKVTPIAKSDPSSTGSRIVDEWNAKAAKNPAPAPKPAAIPAAPNLKAEEPAPAPVPSAETKAEQAAKAQSNATLQDAPPIPAAPNLSPKKLQAEPPVPDKTQSSNAPEATVPDEDPVMTQYKRRLAEGQGQFDKEPMPSAGGKDQGGDFDYSMYTDNGSVKVDESQLQDGVPPAPVVGGDGLADGSVGETPDELLASRLGVRAIAQLPEAKDKPQVAQIQFAYGSAKLSSVDVGVLRKVAIAWKKRGTAHVMVIGHASARTENMSIQEHEKTNRMISERRASAVINQLLALGVNPDTIYVSAEGASDPRYFEGVPAGEAGNRRVEIFMDY
ncbi:OmpA family protein [Thalassospira marina]|uniref:Flagellar motor protein MotB n=1 Tax=Thalassospira marina TaxID=2048283 RepID=A0ABM6Q7V0_9PROT|nr:OmpA family protein [Thalassospira marina]AUG52606.1 flagellar motor protein MotB [Thalassospira marina]